jgi:hypothetical protein
MLQPFSKSQIPVHQYQKDPSKQNRDTNISDNAYKPRNDGHSDQELQFMGTAIALSDDQKNRNAKNK